MELATKSNPGALMSKHQGGKKKKKGKAQDLERSCMCNDNKRQPFLRLEKTFTYSVDHLKIKIIMGRIS